MSASGSREEAEDYAALQSDLTRYEQVCSRIKCLESDNGAWAAGRFYKDAVRLAESALSELRQERASLERLLGDYINPETNDHP